MKLTFTFSQQKGTILPRELVDYVSFVNEPPSAIIPAPPGRKSKDSKSKQKLKTGATTVVRGRGRPPSISEPNPPVPIVDHVDLKREVAARVEGTETVSEGQGEVAGNDHDVDNNEQEEGEEGDEVHNMGEENHVDDDRDNGDDAHNTSVEAMEVGGTAADAEHSATKQSTDPTETETETAAPPGGLDVVLDSAHPMLGLWEGSFNVKVPTGICNIFLLSNR